MGRGNRYKALWDYRSDLARKMDEKGARCDANVGADRGLGIAVLPRLPSSVLLAFLSSCLSRDVGNTAKAPKASDPILGTWTATRRLVRQPPGWDVMSRQAGLVASLRCAACELVLPTSWVMGVWAAFRSLTAIGAERPRLQRPGPDVFHLRI